MLLPCLTQLQNGHTDVGELPTKIMVATTAKAVNQP